MQKRKRSFPTFIRESFPISLRDALISLGILGCGVVLCFFLQFISDTDFHVPLIFVLAVLLVSLFTDGYFFGLIASVLSVFAVNFAFTYPYFHFNFSMTGYPLTFLCMFVVSVSTCTLMSRVRAGEQMRLEAEKEKMRANLLRAISHDFRTPLTS
ncbi:MAG: PAS domain-containing sensor histidine kinase, partial [Oscillospiraceae bacterium]|nr:PAS domain-containing sensor histidine kinase [Oscillospiraceae bacterium]